MNKEDLVGIVNYWYLQAEEAETPERSEECSEQIQHNIGEIAAIELLET